MSRSRWIEGSATFTIVLSSMIMNRPKETAPSVHHFRFSAVKSPARIEKKLALANLRQGSKAPGTGGVLGCFRDRARLDTDRGGGPRRQCRTAHAPPRDRGLLGA